MNRQNNWTGIPPFQLWHRLSQSPSLLDFWESVLAQKTFITCSVVNLQEESSSCGLIQSEMALSKRTWAWAAWNNFIIVQIAPPKRNKTLRSLYQFDVTLFYLLQGKQVELSSSVFLFTWFALDFSQFMLVFLLPRKNFRALETCGQVWL